MSQVHIAVLGPQQSNPQVPVLRPSSLGHSDILPSQNHPKYFGQNVPIIKENKDLQRCEKEKGVWINYLFMRFNFDFLTFLNKYFAIMRLNYKLVVKKKRKCIKHSHMPDVKLEINTPQQR